MSDGGGVGSGAGHEPGAGRPSGAVEAEPERANGAGERVLAGRYRLLRPLAEGGMATVWEGRDEILARPVAVKVPHAGLAADPAFRERFRREAVAAARLAHPGIVATYDTGADGPTDYIVMELVPGRTVRDLVAGGAVPPEVAVPLVAQVAEALDVAHRAGIVHRDIKPANLLLVDNGPSSRVKVADFGVARAQEALDPGRPAGEITRDGVVVGTARYLAPEQVSAGPLDGRTDVYAVGCVLYELLAGRPPFVRDSDLATALAHLTEPPPSLSSLGVSVGPALERLVLSCLSKDPAGRPSSALLLAQQLRAIGAPPAPPPTAAVPAIGITGGNGNGSAGHPPATVALTVGGGAATPAAPRAPDVPPHKPARAQDPPLRRAARAQDPPLRRAARAQATPAPSRSSSRHGTRTVGRPARSRVPLVVVGALVVAALATGAFVVGRPAERPQATTAKPSTSVAAGGPVVADVRSFDPEADGRENDAQLPRLVDGRPTTTWSSDRYNLRPVFGNLKKGVGVVITLERPVRLQQLRVQSPTRAWAAQVYVAGKPAGTLAGWGQPVARASEVQGDLEVDLDGKSGGAVLLWFTDPGRTGQVVVEELELGAP